MSLGGPSQSKNRIAPPERGSFPLDHEGMSSTLRQLCATALITTLGDCKALVKDYLRCIKDNRGHNAPCRYLAKTFLKCRMDHGLMGQDEFTSEKIRYCVPNDKRLMHGKI